MKYSECLDCGELNEMVSASRDELGWHTSCPHCGGSYDIDVEDFLLPNGTKVEMPDGTVGIVDGNDSETSDEFDDINYYVCPIMYTHEEVWSNHYRMHRRSELTLVEEWRLTRRYKDLVSRVCHYPRNEEYSNVPCYNCVDRTKCNADVFERLAQYEDSGYKPEDLARFRQLEDELIEASETTLFDLYEWLQSRKRRRTDTRLVLIARDMQDILENPAVIKKYPKLHDEVSRNRLEGEEGVCPLSPDAYAEWKAYRVDETIEYRK